MMFESAGLGSVCMDTQCVREGYVNFLQGLFGREAKLNLRWRLRSRTMGFGFSWFMGSLTEGTIGWQTWLCKIELAYGWNVDNGGWWHEVFFFFPYDWSKCRCVSELTVGHRGRQIRWGAGGWRWWSPWSRWLVEVSMCSELTVGHRGRHIHRGYVICISLGRNVDNEGWREVFFTVAGLRCRCVPINT
jgi:hypothetical protein